MHSHFLAYVINPLLLFYLSGMSSLPSYPILQSHKGFNSSFSDYVLKQYVVQ